MVLPAQRASRRRQGPRPHENAAWGQAGRGEDRPDHWPTEWLAVGPGGLWAICDSQSDRGTYAPGAGPKFPNWDAAGDDFWRSVLPQQESGGASRRLKATAKFRPRHELMEI